MSQPIMHRSAGLLALLALLHAWGLAAAVTEPALNVDGGEACAAGEACESEGDAAGLLQVKSPPSKEDRAFGLPQVKSERISDELDKMLSRVAETLNASDVMRQAPPDIKSSMDAIGQAKGTTGMASVGPTCYMRRATDCPLQDMPTDRSTSIQPVGDGWNCGCINFTSPYTFQVFPGKSNKLLIYFQDGGACWEPLSATAPFDGTKGLCKEEIHWQGNHGIFDKTDSSNPYRDFTIVHINYCSGDAHAGNSWHLWGRQAGYNNSLAGIQWALAHMDKQLESLSISGASAGSLGAQIWARSILSAFKGKRRGYKRASVVIDSYLGIFPPNTQPYVLQNIFRTCSVPLGQGWREQCGGALTTQLAVSETMAMFPDVPFLFINSKADMIQIAFYAAISFTLLKLLIVPPPDMFYHDANIYFEDYAKHPNFAVFEVEGSHHMFLPTSKCSTESCDGSLYEATPLGPTEGASGSSNAERLYDWLENAINGPANVGTECSGYPAVFNPSAPFSVSLCAKDLVGKRIKV